MSGYIHRFFWKLRLNRMVDILLFHLFVEYRNRELCIDRMGYVGATPYFRSRSQRKWWERIPTKKDTSETRHSESEGAALFQLVLKLPLTCAISPLLLPMRDDMRLDICSRDSL